MYLKRDETSRFLSQLLRCTQHLLVVIRSLVLGGKPRHGGIRTCTNTMLSRASRVTCHRNDAARSAHCHRLRERFPKPAVLWRSSLQRGTRVNLPSKRMASTTNSISTQVVFVKTCFLQPATTADFEHLTRPPASCTEHAYHTRPLVRSREHQPAVTGTDSTFVSTPRKEIWATEQRANPNPYSSMYRWRK